MTAGKQSVSNFVSHTVLFSKGRKVRKQNPLLRYTVHSACHAVVNGGPLCLEVFELKDIFRSDTRHVYMHGTTCSLMILDFGEDPRLGPPLISGGPNLRPLEVLLFYGRSARTATA